MAVARQLLMGRISELNWAAKRVEVDEDQPYGIVDRK